MDALSAILDAVHMKSMVYEKASLSAPWGIDVPQDNNSQFWRLQQGACFLKTPGMPAVEMQQGDLVFVPHGSAHWIADKPGRKLVPSPKYVAARNAGKPMFMGKGAETILIGGHFEFDTGSVHPFLNDLPAIMHIKAMLQPEHSWLQQNSRLLFEELSTERPGSKIIISRLAEIMFIYLIRAYVEQADETSGFLLALRDDRISKGLKLMQEFPARAWTVPDLAKNTGMSRTLFFNKFKKIAGEMPMSYLTNWRMVKAKEILAVSKENISAVAEQVGYQSEAAFNRVFKQKTGETPASYRRSRQR
jgi:AraC-like DNA-binding protein